MTTNEYLATQEPTVHPVLLEKLEDKLNYLTAIKTAIQEHNDLKLYSLLDYARYQEVIGNRSDVQDDNQLAAMVTNLRAELSHFLAQELITYLSNNFPFFYYKEIINGEYEIYFGNWWDRRRFGTLNVLELVFEFDEIEYAKLEKSVELATNGIRFNSDNIAVLTDENEKLQKLIDTQAERETAKEQLRIDLDEANNTRTGLFNGTKAREQREELVEQLAQLQADDEKATQAHQKIQENNDKILGLSKEDTILMYEQKSIEQQFKTFSEFEKQAQALYPSYITFLINNTGEEA